MKPTFAPNCPIDIEKLLETRLLIQASSGGGKSYALRRLLEQTAPHVQQLIIDPEGEFATLREKYDYIIAAPQGGDAVVNPKTAGLLARRLLEAGVSAVLDIYELRADERQRFTRLFLDALVNAPRELWRPVMVVLDEAHMFCPQNGSAEAMQSVIDVATRGRKRGQCLVLATQRLSKLHKDAAAEMLNKLIGGAQLDVDIKRAADDLGMNTREAGAAVKSLARGEFYALGPALTGTVTKIKVGECETAALRPGARASSAPPAPSPKIRAQLARLADLQKDAELEAKTIEELKAEIARLKREAKKPAGDSEEISQWKASVLKERQQREKAFEHQQKQVDALRKSMSIISKVASTFANADADVKVYEAASHSAVTSWEPSLPGSVVVPTKLEGRGISGDDPIDLSSSRSSLKSSPTLRAGAVKILKELASRAPAGYSRTQVGALTKFSHKGGTFLTYLSDLRRAGVICERDGLLYATQAGIALFGDALPSPTTHEEVMAQWEKALRAGAYKMLVVIARAHEEGLHRANLADLVGMTATGGTFLTYLSDLRRNGLISERGKRLYANDILFPLEAK